MLFSATLDYSEGASCVDDVEVDLIMKLDLHSCSKSLAMNVMLFELTTHLADQNQWTLVSQLIQHERIETTFPKAMEVKRFADKMVTLGKDGTLCAARRAAAFVRGDHVIHKLFTELAYRYKHREGGYTRVLRNRIRMGDAATMATIEFVDREDELRKSKPATTQPQNTPGMDPWTRSRLSRSFAPPKREKTSDSDT
ncbi:hypothetical protein GIB67_028574 [Kingdonia uniflora]|uniref:50S ribosomal protein L17 n=1 Tax=Kingdonia uniflora TaxID=39325 RepID=A0A7J7NV85_9MAGN|nr:hypothetical protein GIB67_028574 [Kingdonia uniflora]